uniref:Reverse transcriptase domain-containing protein n=1 Tax=Tanacetum cinerariifolium TaxID=118510 RepID=A0A6L2LFE3_TANCI|nr:reverse transcriptase domain-containing protein [Tanacetum cinerariifolium]
MLKSYDDRTSLCIKDLLCSCHEHGLGRGTIIQIFYHGLDDATYAILDVGGIFICTDNSKLMEKMEALTTKIDSQCKEIKGEMKEMRDGCNNCGCPHPSSECDDKPMGGPKKEANYVYGGYRGGVGMPNYGKFVKELVSNKSKMEKICVSFLNEECSAIVQNKLPPKLGDPGSFLIPCTLANSFEFLSLADLDASINYMPYSLYASLFVNTLKPKRMSIRLANHTYQYLMGVAENMLVQDRKFVFPVDFVILKMKEDVIDEVTKEEFDALLNDYDQFLSTSEKINGTFLDNEFKEFMAVDIEEILEQEEEIDENFEELPLEEKLRIKPYIQEPPIDLEMQPLPKHLKYAFMEKDSLFPVVISALLKSDEK